MRDRMEGRAIGRWSETGFLLQISALSPRLSQKPGFLSGDVRGDRAGVQRRSGGGQKPGFFYKSRPLPRMFVETRFLVWWREGPSGVWPETGFLLQMEAFSPRLSQKSGFLSGGVGGVALCAGRRSPLVLRTSIPSFTFSGI